MARKILLADDSVTAQNMGRKILADAGYEVITVNNGSAALKKIGEQRPDLIVLDVYMPGYSGLEVCQRLKEAGETSRIPVLLTVGKLEPFKPEEAKRVRADGFIVKPFEASELLSALTRLEDKIVPRNESSKPGRFARALASDDGRFDKTMAIDEDSGWKNRISFPAKKKAKEAEPEEPEVAKPASKDLRGVAEQAPVHAPSHQKPEERVDLGALAPLGLPKDVTPEEIAALAAAAARMKGKIAEAREDASAEMPVVPPAPSEEQSQAPSSADFSVADMPASAAVTLAAQSETRESEAKDASVPQEAGIFQSAYSDSRVEVETSGSAKEPFTMAAAAGESGSTTTRWTAVSVALSPEDAAISLEQEMQKAYAVYAAAETGHTASASMTAPMEIGMPPQNTVPEESVSVPATIAPEAAQTLSAVASAAADAVSAAVKELENVASSYAAQAFTPVETTAPSAPEIATDTTEHVQSSYEAPAATTEIPHPGNNESESQKAADPELIAETTAKALPALDSASAEKNAESSAAATELHPELVAASSSEQPSDSLREPAHKESDIAATSPSTNGTPVSESGNGHLSPAEAEASPAVAMAAAVAGQKILEEAQAEDSDIEIASIVDSVLANLRPKIVAEISRKLGKK